MSRSIKMLSLLVAVQIVLMAMWFIRLDMFEDRMDALAKFSGQVRNGETIDTEAPAAESVDAPGGVDSQQLRQIIREELQAVLGDSERVARESSAETEKPVYDDIEMQYQQDLILNQMEILKGQDEVSSMELDRLMGQIARLDPERRKEMFRVLNRAINRGEIRGIL